MKIQTFIEALRGGKADHALKILYGNSPTAIESQQRRYIHAVSRFSELFPQHDDIRIFSSLSHRALGRVLNMRPSIKKSQIISHNLNHYSIAP